MYRTCAAFSSAFDQFLYGRCRSQGFTASGGSVALALAL